MGGFFDYVLGFAFYSRNKQSYIEYDGLTKGEKILPKYSKAWSLTKDIAELTAATGGYNDLDDYKDKCSVIHELGSIKRPIFFLSSLDDPFFGTDVIPYNHESEHLLIGTTPNGSHCGWIEG